MDFSINYKWIPRSLQLLCLFPLVHFVSHVEIANKPRGRRKGRVGAAAAFTSQKPSGSAGGLKPTSRLPSVGFEMWQTLRMTVQTTDAAVKRGTRTLDG